MAYSEPCHIHNLHILRTFVCTELWYTWSHSQTSSTIYDLFKVTSYLGCAIPKNLLKCFISKQICARLNTLLYNMLKVIQKPVIPAVHMKTPSLFRNRAKSRKPPSPGSQAYLPICQKSAIERFMELMQIDICTIFKYEKLQP